MWIYTSSYESQKGAFNIQRRSVENQKGTIARLCTAIVPFWFSTDDIYLISCKALANVHVYTRLQMMLMTYQKRIHKHALRYQKAITQPPLPCRDWAATNMHVQRATGKQNINTTRRMAVDWWMDGLGKTSVWQNSLIKPCGCCKHPGLCAL